MPPRLPAKIGQAGLESLSLQELMRAYVEQAAADPLRYWGTPTPVQNSGYVAKPGEIVLCNPAGGGFTVTLPRITVAVLGQHVVVWEVAGSANAITVVPGDANATIANSASDTISTANDSQVYVALLPSRPTSQPPANALWGKR